MLKTWVLFFLMNTSMAFDEAVLLDHVLKQFPAVQMAQSDVDIAEAEQLTAVGSFDVLLQGSALKNTGYYNNQYFNAKLVKPTSLFGLDLYAGFRRGTGNFAIYDQELQTLDRGEWSIGAKLPLLRDFIIDEKRAKFWKSKINIQQKKYQLQSTEIEYVKNALHRYWDWVYAAKKWHVQGHLLDIAKTRDQWLQKKVKAGDVAKFERDDNLRNILQRTSAQLSAEQGLVAASSELGYYIQGSELFSRLSEPPTFVKEKFSLRESHLVNLPTERLTELALQQRPDLLGLSAQIEQNQIENNLQNNRYLPKLDLQGQYSKDNGSGPANLVGDNVKAMLVYEVPIQYRAIGGRAGQVFSLGQKLNQQRKLLEQRITADIKIIQKNLEVSLLKRNLAEQEWELALALEKGERARLTHGETHVLFVNIREQATVEAELRFVEASIDAIKYMISLAAIVGEMPLLKR